MIRKTANSVNQNLIKIETVMKTNDYKPIQYRARQLPFSGELNPLELDLPGTYVFSGVG